VIEASRILEILDTASDRFSFPMLDNGYIYLAACRLTTWRSDDAWALVIEKFGFSPRAEVPDTSIYTFSNRLINRTSREGWPPAAYDKYLLDNPCLEQRSAWPFDDDTWQDPEDPTLVAEGATHLRLRGVSITLPGHEEYARLGITLEQAPRVQVFEVCRWLAETRRERVLATVEERGRNLDPSLRPLLQLEEWHHPDLADGERPSASTTFRQLADVLATGGIAQYRPPEPPNTHWSNWPDGGRL
jgi:hypothetical protein